MLNLQILEKIAGDWDFEVKEDDTSFECPKCGSSYFGSGGIGSGSFYCHDEFNVGCRWSGPAPECFTTYSKETLANEILKLYAKNT